MLYSTGLKKKFLISPQPKKKKNNPKKPNKIPWFYNIGMALREDKWCYKVRTKLWRFPNTHKTETYLKCTVFLRFFRVRVPALYQVIDCDKPIIIFKTSLPQKFRITIIEFLVSLICRKKYICKDTVILLALNKNKSVRRYISLTFRYFKQSIL